jgi:hypothetical protein
MGALIILVIILTIGKTSVDYAFDGKISESDRLCYFSIGITCIIIGFIVGFCFI